MVLVVVMNSHIVYMYKQAWPRATVACTEVNGRPQCAIFRKLAIVLNVYTSYMSSTVYLSLPVIAGKSKHNLMFRSRHVFHPD